MVSNDSIPMERFSYHSLHLSTGLPLLLADQQLILDHCTGYSLLIDWKKQEDQILNAVTFTEEELSVVFTLATNWPSYVLYETLMAGTSEEAPSPSEINDARATGNLNALIAPLHELIAPCRAKMQVVNLDIREIDRYGYRLARAEHVLKGSF